MNKVQLEGSDHAEKAVESSGQEENWVVVGASILSLSPAFFSPILDDRTCSQANGRLYTKQAMNDITPEDVKQ